MGEDNKTKTPVGRTKDNVLDTQFHLLFVERIYDGSPRWWTNEWEKHYHTVPGANGDRLDREPGVKKLMALAQDWKSLFNVHVPYLITCVNPECPLRSWLTVNFLAVKKSDVVTEKFAQFDQDISPGEREGFRKAITYGLQQMANGRMKDLKDQCPQCSHKQPVFGVSPIEGKWVYALKESGGQLQPYVEIFMETPQAGTIYTQFKNGSFTGQGRSYPGYLVLDKIKEFTWHFFLSPKRLGPKALALLSSAPKKEPDYIKGLWDLHPGRWNVGVIPELQPWSTTVKRRFQDKQLQTPYEFIPLVDASMWVAEIAEYDYLPIVAAQQKLIQDSDEQAKSFIAATMAQVMGRKQVSDNPPKYVEDTWDVKEDTAEVPHDFRGSGNIAKAWIDRYQAALQFLTDQSNFACTRLSYCVRFSLAHRINELACQENTDDPEFLGFGLTHWAHILREMLLCQAGEAFTMWLARNKGAADRIPQKNVLGGENLEPGSKIGHAIGLGLPVHILAYLSPAIIAGSDNPAKDLSSHLEKIDIKATTLGVKELQATRDLVLSIAGDQIKKYAAKFPKTLDPSQLHAATVADSWQARIQSFGTMKEAEKIFSLLSAVAEFGKKGGRYQTDWERYSKNKEVIETPLKVVEYLAEKSHKLIKAGLKGEAVEIAEKLESKGFQALSVAEADLLSASRSLAAFKYVGVGIRVLAGPIGVITGGCELVIQMGEMAHAMESGDPGAAVAHGIQAAAAALLIVVAGAECVALVSGAAAAAWAGPIGWIAAGLMLVGALVMWLAGKNDLQLYAKHSFLGDSYGMGGWETTGKSWMATWGWASLRHKEHSEHEDSGRFQRQRLALLRMLTGFSTWIGFSTYAGGYIIPSYVPSGAHFDVEVDVMPKGLTSPKETYRAIIWPMDGNTGDFAWKGQEPQYNSYIKIERKGSQVSLIDVKARPRGFGDPIDYNLRVRLAYDSSAKNTLPATVEWVKNTVINLTEYREVSSSEAEAEGD